MTSTDSSGHFASHSADVARATTTQAEDSDERMRDLEDESSTDGVPPSLVDEIIESTSDLPNRYYRYPAARALLRVVSRISWLTPNHVTYAHIAIGMIAACLVAFTEARAWLFLAFALCEARMILDCFDGVLARARGMSSPFGRALDEIADSIAFITMICAMTHRLHLGARGVLIACTTMVFGGLSANAWDFYKRKITTSLRDGKDGVLDELREKKALIESGKGSFLGYWGVYFDCFQVLLYEVRPIQGDPVSVIRARAKDPLFRRFVSVLAFLSFDNGLGILHLGVLTGLFLQSELCTLLYAFVVWLAAIALARIVLRDYPATRPRSAP